MKLVGESESILTSHQKLEQEMPWYAAQCGNTAAVKHFAEEAGICEVGLWWLFINIGKRIIF